MQKSPSQRKKWEILWKLFRKRDHWLRNEKTERAAGFLIYTEDQKRSARKKKNQTTALRFQTGDGHQTSLMKCHDREKGNCKAASKDARCRYKMMGLWQSCPKIGQQRPTDVHFCEHAMKMRTDYWYRDWQWRYTGQIIDTETDSDVIRDRALILRLTMTLHGTEHCYWDCQWRYAGQIIDTETDSDVIRDRLLVLRLTVTLRGTDYRYRDYYSLYKSCGKISINNNYMFLLFVFVSMWTDIK